MVRPASPRGGLPERLRQGVRALPRSRRPAPLDASTTCVPLSSVALEAFGVDRLMFGSDWPICEVAGGYDRVMRALVELTADSSEAERTALRGETAIRCYGLELA